MSAKPKDAPSTLSEVLLIELEQGVLRREEPAWSAEEAEEAEETKRKWGRAARDAQRESRRKALGKAQELRRKRGRRQEAVGGAKAPPPEEGPAPAPARETTLPTDSAGATTEPGNAPGDGGA